MASHSMWAKPKGVGVIWDVSPVPSVSYTHLTLPTILRV